MIKEVINKFKVSGEFVDSKLYGSGHINETYLVSIKTNEKTEKFILRKINQTVFKNPEIVVYNSLYVTNHLRRKSTDQDSDKRIARLIETKENDFYFVDKNGEYWCLLVFIKDALTIDCVEKSVEAFNAAKAFGNFVYQLSDLDADQIEDTIPDFHNLEARLDQFRYAIKSGDPDRKKLVEKEIELINDNLNISAKLNEALKNPELPTRIIHNDTKISNVMFDVNTGESLAVIDLDTVMQGAVLFDFGDMVRSYTNSRNEDDPDISTVEMRIEIFEAIVKGYFEGMQNGLIEIEINNLVLGSEVIVLEQAVRFLSDFIMKDVYYQTEYEDHNLDRAKNQLALLRSIQSQKEEMSAIIKKHCS